MKRISVLVTFLLACAVALGLSSCGKLAALPGKANFDGNIAAMQRSVIDSPEDSGECGDSFKWYYADGVLVVTGEGSMADHKSVEKDEEGAEHLTRDQHDWDAHSDDVTTLIVGEGITGIVIRAFDGFSRLKNLYLPSTLKEIGHYAFSDTAITVVPIPKLFPNDGAMVAMGFNGCRLTGFDVDEESIFYAVKDGVLYNARMNILYCYPWADPRESYEIEPGTLQITGFAFDGCENLKTITIPDSLDIINDRAFYKCLSLEHITVPEGVTTIYNFAFYACPMLTKVTLPESLTEIRRYAFGACSSMKTIRIPTGVKAIDENAFTDTMLETIDYGGRAGGFPWGAGTHSSGKVE